MKFSIRDLLWLTVVAAFAVAWGVDRTRLAQTIESQKREQLEQALRLREDAARMSAQAQAALKFLRTVQAAEENETENQADPENRP